MDSVTLAVALATQTFNKHPNYAQKLIHKFPTPLVISDSIKTTGKKNGPNDLWGYWYECLYETALQWPDKAAEPRLHCVMAYRYMMNLFRAKNALKCTGPSEWDCQDEKKRKYYHEFLEYQTLIDEDNFEDEF
jgi:hypothetical protein